MESLDSSQNSDILKKYISGSEDSINKSKLSVLDILFESKAKNINYVLGFQAGLESLDVSWNDLSRVEFNSAGKMIKAADLLFLGGGSNVESDREKYAIFSELYPLLSDDLDLKISARFEKNWKRNVF